MSKTNLFKYGISAAIMALTILAVAPTLANDEQARLDAACEAARQEKLAPLRAGFIDECVEKSPDRAACERFYADFGNQSGNRAPLFYDLPECVEAFEFRRK